MPLISKSGSDRRAFSFGRSSALRSLNEVVEQLQEQLRKEREQHRFDATYYEEQIGLLLKEICELRYELSRRDTREAFAAAPSPSASRH